MLFLNIPFTLLFVCSKVCTAYITRIKVRSILLNQLYKKVRKKRGRAKILASIVVSLGPDDKGKDIQARIVFVRDRNRSKKWLALLSTNIELPDEEVVRTLWETLGYRVLFQSDQIPPTFSKRIPIPQLRCDGSPYHDCFGTLYYACFKFTGRRGSKNDWTALLFCDAMKWRTSVLRKLLYWFWIC